MSKTQFPCPFGKYILLDRINSGGMAEVYRAKVTGVEQFERLLAIKCMLPKLAEDESFTTMFVDEAKLASQLNHANIVHIYELGSTDGQLYIAMELVNGRDLRHVVKTAYARGQRLPVAFAAYVVAKAAEGLAFAHERPGVDGLPLNIVHRDVSPQNILVSYDGEVKVVDFGIAKAEQRATETRAGVLKGKFAYMAPEQVAGKKVDARADIFALGTVLFEALTGQKLFAGESDLSLLTKVRNCELPNFQQVLPDGQEDLIAVLGGCLQLKPKARFQSASDVAAGLNPLLISERKIFGARDAKEFMHALYAAEIEVLADKIREYAGVVVAPDEHRRRPSKVFESDFDSETPTAIADARDLSRPQVTRPATDYWDEPASATPPAVAVDVRANSDVAEVDERRYFEPTRARGTSSRPWVSSAVLGAALLLAAVLAVVLSRRQPTVEAVHAREAAVQVTEVPAAPASAPVPPPAEPVVAPAQQPKVASERPEPRRKQPKTPAKFGYIAVKASGVAAARVFVDGADRGYQPLFAERVTAGRREIRIVEEGGAGRSKSVVQTVSENHTRRDPLKVFVSF
jgi:serine/threonine protein kinase